VIYVNDHNILAKADAVKALLDARLF